MSDTPDDPAGNNTKESGVVVLQIDLSELTIEADAAMQTRQGVDHLRADIVRMLAEPKNILAIIAIMPVAKAFLMMELLNSATEMMGEPALHSPEHDPAEKAADAAKRAIVIRGDFTDTEFTKLCGLIRTMDSARPGAFVEIINVDAGPGSMEIADQIIRGDA